MTDMDNTKRLDSIDIAKGITILLMVLGHCHLQPDFKYLYLWIFSFHMPLFFFLSGYFFRQKSNKELIKTDLNKLVKPYIQTAIFICGFLLCFESPNAASIKLIGFLMGVDGNKGAMFQIADGWGGPIWFLLALFWCRLFYNLLHGICAKHEFVLSLILSVIAWQIGYRIINLPVCILVGITALMFYSAGHNIRKIGLDRFKLWHYLLGIIIWLFSVFIGTYLNMAQYIFMKFPLSIIVAVIGTITMLKFSTYIKGYAAIVLTFLGKHSLDILIAHTFAMLRKTVLQWFDIDFSNNMINDVYNIIFTAIIATVIISFKEYRLQTRYISKL